MSSIMENIVKQNLTEGEKEASGFVKFEFSSEDALLRRNTVRDARADVLKAINATRGDMTTSLRLKYERLNMLIDDIITEENDIMRFGR